MSHAVHGGLLAVQSTGAQRRVSAIRTVHGPRRPGCVHAKGGLGGPDTGGLFQSLLAAPHMHSIIKLDAARFPSHSCASKHASRQVSRHATSHASNGIKHCQSRQPLQGGHDAQEGAEKVRVFVDLFKI